MSFLFDAHQNGSLKEIPAEVYEVVDSREFFDEGRTIKVRHLYRDDGSVCSIHKSKALAITRTDSGWKWYCHRCGCAGGLKEYIGNSKQVKERMSKQKKLPAPKDGSLPEDTIQITDKDLKGGSRRIPWDAQTWLIKHGIKGALINRHYFGWSSSYSRVIMPIQSSKYTQKDYVNGPALMGWVGRDVKDLSKAERNTLRRPKYLQKKFGGTDRLIYTAHSQNPEPGKPIVFVEDILSAVRVAEAYNTYAFAMLNADIPQQLLDSLIDRNALYVMWLDHDMTTKMINLCSKYRILGYRIKYVSTLKDPKCYNDVGISTVLNKIASGVEFGITM